MKVYADRTKSALKKLIPEKNVKLINDDSTNISTGFVNNDANSSDSENLKQSSIVKKKSSSSSANENEPHLPPNDDTYSGGSDSSKLELFL